MSIKSVKIWMYLVAKIFVIIGALNWGLIAINPEYNILNNFNNLVNKIILGVIGVSAVYVAMQRKTFLPFLDECVMPIFNYLGDTTTAKLTEEGSRLDYNKLIIKIPDGETGTKIVYWAASPNDKLQDNPENAYADFNNSGISDIVNGIAILAVKCPAEYKVPVAGRLPKHIHFRVVDKDGMLSRIYSYKNDITKLCG
jgi:uncharacterized membrane protein YuzA (DUF378 family)